MCERSHTDKNITFKRVVMVAFNPRVMELNVLVILPEVECPSNISFSICYEPVTYLAGTVPGLGKPSWL